MQTRHADKGAANPASGTVGITVADVLDTVKSSLEDSKAEAPVTIDIQGKSALGDYMIIASGRSHRHVGAIADHLLRDLKDLGLAKPRVEGLPGCDWVLIDTGDIIVHIFRPEVREFYGIERMWQMPDHSEVH
jgi:ribosome-associated protein